MTTRVAYFSIFKYSHTGIEQTANFRLRPFIGGVSRNFNNGATLDLLWREDTELNAYNGFNVGRVLVKS
jgi:hypothetical protein